MALNFPDIICELIHGRFKLCLPLGLYKIWFPVRDSTVEGLGDLLGYSDKDFAELVNYSALSRQNGAITLETWQQKLHISVEVNRVYFRGERFNTVRFGDRITTVDSPGAQINRSDELEWSNLTYKDRESMDLFIDNYGEKYLSAYAIKNCLRLPLDIVRFIKVVKYNRRHPPVDDNGRNDERVTY